MNTNLKQARNAAFLALSLITFSAAVTAGPFHDRHGMHHPLERMVELIDLTDEQEDQVEQILEDLKKNGDKKQRLGMMKAFVELDPESPDYELEVETQANKVAEQVKTKILAASKARQEIYGLLTEEQKEELKQASAKKLKKMEKRMARMHH